MVPLTQGVKLDLPWPLLPPGSAVSLVNYLPLDGSIRPRSRLSSTGTVRAMAAIQGIHEVTPDGAGAVRLWVSGTTKHGIWSFGVTGRISLASFTSTGGFGNVPTAQNAWDYALSYIPAFGNAVIIAGKTSHDTLQMLLDNGTVATHSYVPGGAPMARCVGAFDNYVVAANIAEGSSHYNTRVQWSKRGEPTEWTGEGSGFEDLLNMPGRITKVRAFGQIMVLFSEFQIWYATPATYPAQFQFYPLDETVGCPFPGTIQETDEGLLFLGTDMHPRLLPKGGGVSRVVAPHLAPELRYIAQPSESMNPGTFAVFDPLTKLYHLFYEPADGGARRCLALHTMTGEYGYLEYADPPQCGTYASRLYLATRAECLFFGGSNGTVFSTSSLLAGDSGSTVTQTYRSAPIAADLAGQYKTLTNVFTDYRSASSATLTIRVSQDGGNTYASSGYTVTLDRKPVSGRAETQMYVGGAFPVVELTSTSTGYELHRMDVQMSLGGRV